MRVPRLLLLACGVATCGLALAGCAYDLKREIADGEVSMDIVDADGDPAKAAHASIPGTDRLAEADGKGHLSLAGLPVARSIIALALDDNDDGTADQAALIPFQTQLARVPKNLGDGVLAEPPEVVTGLLLGHVKLTRTHSIGGAVTEDGAALAVDRFAQIVVVRILTLAGDDAFDATLPVEAAASADADGAFRVDGVAQGGTVWVAALVRTGEDGSADKFGAVELDALKDDATDVAIDVTEDLAGTASLQLTLFGGKERSTVDSALFFAPGTTTTIGDAPIGETAGSHVVDAPQGVFDLQVQTEDGFIGFAHGVLSLGDRFALLVPMELPALLEPCGAGADRDCDKDGAKAIDPTDAAALDACDAACSGKHGADLDGARCSGKDCDDDADGVADVDERACIGPLVGTDLDSDDLCEPAADPFPGCAENTATDCL